MERNQIIGLTLIMATLFAWIWYNGPTEAQKAEMKHRQDSIAAIQDTLINKPTLTAPPAALVPTFDMNDTAAISGATAAYGAFATSVTGKAQDVVLENESLKLTFSTKGGYIKEAILKKHMKTLVDSLGKNTKTNVVLMADPKNRFEYTLPLADATVKEIRSSELFFEPIKTGNSITFVAKTINGGSFEQKYTLTDEYALTYEVATKGLSKSFGNKKELNLLWENFLPQNERGKQFEQNYSTAYFKEKAEKVDYCNCVANDTKDIAAKPIEWISNVNQFFNTSLIATATPFSGAKLQTTMVDILNTPNSKHITSQIVIPVTDANNGNFAMKMYIGPNEFERLQATTEGLEEVIPFGSSIFGTINRWLIRPFFDFLSSFISSKGLVIIMLIFLIKMLLYPLMYKTLFSQAKMAALKPEIEAIKAKAKDDTQKQQVETMKLYQEFGVSPLGGCLPMLLQAPIWYALFRFFPASITFRQEPFLWATDLSSYDVLFNLGFEIPFFGSHVSLFTLLWAVSTIVYTYYSMQNVDMSANPAMKYVQYIMPVMFLAFFNNYASGLTCYMFFSNLINILQTIVTKKYIFDEAKIREDLLKEKAKPKKKGGFATRLEEAVKQQQANQEAKKKK